MNDLDYYIAQARVIHGDLYEYLELYRRPDKYPYLKIKCKQHGLFEKRTSNHISRKQGCPSCTQKHKLTQEDFLAKAKVIHGEKYSYDKAIYTKGHAKLIITCGEHGDFEMSATNHLSGQNCPSCNKHAPLTTESLISKLVELRGNQYDYSKIEHQHTNIPVTVICPEHGEFLATTHNLLDPRTIICCHRCNPRGKVRCTKDFIEDASLIHQNIYDYSKVDYQASIEKVIISCSTHGDFLQRPNDHLSGDGCPLCGKGRCSKICIEWLDKIASTEKISIQHAINGGEKTVTIEGKKYFFDGYDENTNTVYEFYGDFHHGNPELYNRDDINPLIKISFGELYDKTMARESILRNAGYNIVSIWEKIFKDKYGKQKNTRMKESINLSAMLSRPGSVR